MTQFVAFFELFLEAMYVPRRLRLRSSWSSGSMNDTARAQERAQWLAPPIRFLRKTFPRWARTNR
jgi:hypothetical protein